MKNIEDFNLKGQSVFLRLDLNVPLKNGSITDETRIQAALPTIKYAIDKGARLVLASHLGRPKTDEDRKTLSLAPVAERLGELLNVEVLLVEEPSGDAPRALLGGLNPRQVLLLENLRFEKGETKNDTALAEAWAKYTDIYINDAFGASHRAHASIDALPKLVEKKGCGFLIRKELDMLGRLKEGSESPFVAVLGGAKVSDKIKVLEKLAEKVDTMLIGGAMAYTFLKAKGFEVGNSLIEEEKVRVADKIIEAFRIRGKELLLPVDHKTVSSFDDVGSLENTTDENVSEGRMGIDIGEKTLEFYKSKIAGSKLIFWNGPMGVFETPEYAQGTFGLAEAVAVSDATSVIGGGDSAAAIVKAGYSDQVTHVSTGGGASLEYLQGEILPGIAALN